MHIQLTIISRLKAAPSEAKGKGKSGERRQLPCLKPALNTAAQRHIREGDTLSWRNVKAGWLELALQRASY